MDRIEKCKLAVYKGFKYIPSTGIIFGVKGSPLNKKINGYFVLTIWDNKNIYLYAHQFAWYVIYNEIVELIDHKNRIKTDNRIVNLRESTKQLNALNNEAKGCSFYKPYNKWQSYLMLDGKKHHLGYFDLEEEAHDVYLLTKKEKLEELWKLQEN